MSVSFHPSQDLLTAYADGSLPATPGLAVAAHLAACSRCAAHVSDLEETAGALLLSEPGAAMAPDALDRALDAISGQQAPPKRVQRANELPPSISGARLGMRFKFPRGMWMTPVLEPRRGGWRAVLVHAPANSTLPLHDHSGPEYTYVVEGAYWDRGVRYQQGDFASSDPDTKGHTLLVTAAGPCTCLIATLGPLKFRPPLSLVAPLIGL